MQRMMMRNVTLAVLAVGLSGTACTSNSTGDDATSSSSSSSGGGGSSAVVSSGGASTSRPASSAGGGSSGVVVSSSAGGGSSGVVVSSSAGGGSSGVVVSSSAGGGSSGVVVSSSAGGGSSGVVGSSSGGGSSSSSGGLPPETVCNDLFDNDLDQLFDCADPDCQGTPACVAGAGAVGTTCTSNNQCAATGGDPLCFNELIAGYPAGYCTEGCVGGTTLATGTGCSGSGVCLANPGVAGFCRAACGGGVNCRTGYTCQQFGTTPDVTSVCVPDCTDNAECGVTNLCDTNPFSTTLGRCITCGNGVIDTAAGEECEGTTAPAGQKCESCQLSPDTWTCPAAYYDSGFPADCDCGCGIVDPDCANATVGACNYCADGCSQVECANNPPINPTNNAVCVVAACGNNVREGAEECDGTDVLAGRTCLADCTVNVPGTWTCDRTYFFDNDCDCGCGVLDPTCANATLAACAFCSSGCSTQACAGNTQINPTNNAVCIAPTCGNNVAEGQEECDGTDVAPGYTCSPGCTIVVPATWSCPAAYFLDTTCDCGCGVRDPACADGTLAVCVSCVDGCSTQACAGNTEIDPVNNAVCPAYTCGNNIREGGEVCDGTDTPVGQTCNPANCTLAVPTAWTCNPAWYADADCDCGCGALDPTCANATLAACDVCGLGCSTQACAGNTQINPANNAVCL